MWKSEIRNSPPSELEREVPNPAYDEWVDAMMEEPWFVALRDLVKWTGTWVGTEEELVAEVRLRVDREVRESEDFPSDFGTLMDYHHILYYSRFGLGLEIYDHREFKKRDLEEFDVPGWGPEAPILVERDHAGKRPDYYDAMRTLARYRSPLALALLIFTDGPRFARHKRRWTGRTSELAEALAGSYPNPGLNCPVYLPELAGYPDAEPTSFYDDGTPELLRPETPADYAAFCRSMRTCAHIVKEVGIEVTWEKMPFTFTDPEGNRETKERTYWTVAAKRWCHDSLGRL